MNEFRFRKTGAVISELEFRQSRPDTSFPAVLDAATLDVFGADAVLPAPAPTITPYQIAQRVGAVQDALGNWVQAWAVQDLDAAAVDAIKVQEQVNLQAQIVQSVQQRLDTFAKAVVVDAQGRSHGNYDSVNSLAKYQNLTDAQIASLPVEIQPLVTMFRTDCQYLALTTAHTWASLWGTLAAVQAGNWPTTGAGQSPTGYADIEPSLPALGWPA